ncbi:hypothetical protein EDD22DRAFT_848692 [Suillus occidentalis]|nr:hypothetical protein EDD22DRAFT_848692 [Suillus occidentalis]
MPRSKGMSSTSSRVKMSVLNTSHSLRTTTASLTQIRHERLEEERRRAEQMRETQHFRALMAEAQLESGQNNNDFTQYDDTAHEYEDFNQPEDSGDVASGPLFAELFQTTDAPLVKAYMQWTCKMTEASGDHEGHAFSVAAVGIMDFTTNIDILQRPGEPANVALLRYGLLSCSPVQPTVAIHLHCLELYHQIRRRQSSFSIQSITKVLCTLHNVTYSRHLREQFAIAFDIYLQVKREVQQLVDHALNRDGADWHLKGSCPCCGFEQPNEPQLIPRRLHSMDGNHSTKRLEGSGSADQRLFRSRYFIPVSAVERFRNDVCNRPGEHLTGKNITCTEKWTATKSVEEDKISVFEQTGIFILACRHGFLQSMGFLSSIGCLKSVVKTKDLATTLVAHPVKPSRLVPLAISAAELNLIVAVNSFSWWDQDKYLELSHFLHSNYVQALGIIEDHTQLLEEFMARTSVTKDDFIRWQQEESEFLNNLAEEPPSDAIAASYVEELEKLCIAESTYGGMTSVPYLTYTPADFSPSSGLNASTRQQSKTAEAQRLSVLRRYQLQINELEGLVIQCLFELSKANLAGTGYKMRKYISKAIACHSATIRNALEKYNQLAPLQIPPQPILDYADVVGYATLGEFTLLKYSHHDFLSKPWAVPETQEMGAKYFKLIRSHEEIVHLNVEIGCLDTWVEYDDGKMIEVIEMLVADDPSSLLAAELKRQYSVHHRINNIHRCHLHNIRQLKGYSGPIPLMQHDFTEMEGQDDEGSDELNDEASHLKDTISRIGE